MVAVENPREAVLAFYAQHSPITDPGERTGLFEGLPDDVPGLAQVVQGLLMHPSATDLYGQLPEPDNPGWGYCRMADLLERIVALDDAPLTVARSPDRRLRANCRNFAVLFVAMLRHRGVPARKRVGFASYLPGPMNYSHEIAEYWDARSDRWVLVDPQMDDACCAASRTYFATIGQPGRVDFDPLDIRPGGPFYLAGDTWRLCRAGQADPDAFRVTETVKGFTEIRYQLLLDLAALNKLELLSPDAWHGLMAKPEPEVTSGEAAFLDGVAALTADPGGCFNELRELFGDMTGSQAVQSTLREMGLG